MGAFVADEPDLHQGMEGEWVTSMQQWLTHLGFYGGAVDGSFGPATQEAVNNIQTHYSISDGGVVGAETWHLINMAATKDQTSLEHNWSGSEINTVDVPEMTDPEAQS